MGIGSAIAGGLLGGLSDMWNGAINSLYHWEQNNWKSDYDVTQELRDYDKNVSDYFLDKQMDFNREMASTAYQRAVADMKAAGINPATMAGVNAAQSASPAATAGYHHGSNHSAAATKFMDSALASTYFNSAVNAMIAKDKSAADLLAQEFVDNARHAHYMEESQEQRAMYKEQARLNYWKGTEIENRTLDSMLRKS